MNNIKLTIFTPAYNRAHLLSRLYESIKKQSRDDIEWLIVDDGSADDTKSAVDGFITENKVNIRYFYQENAGKPSAFNNGVSKALGELFFCVDSDDLLADGAVEAILDIPLDNEKLAGILALKSDLDSKILSDRIPDALKISNMYRLINYYGCSGEFSLVFRTEILKAIPYPIVSGEKFITECVVYDKIDENYEMYLLDRVLTVCEYQQGGLSDDSYSVMLKNPTGYKIYYSQRIDMALSLKERIGYIIRYHAFKVMSRDTLYNYRGKNQLLVSLLRPLGPIIAYYYKSKR